MTDFDLGIMGANGIVAGGIPMAVGAALAFKKQSPPIPSPFHGEDSRGAYALRLPSLAMAPQMKVRSTRH